MLDRKVHQRIQDLHVIGKVAHSRLPMRICSSSVHLFSFTVTWLMELSQGRLLPEYFPSIFGPNEDLPLDQDITRNKFLALAQSVSSEIGREMSPEEVALGFLNVANEVGLPGVFNCQKLTFYRQCVDQFVL